MAIADIVARTGRIRVKEASANSTDVFNKLKSALLTCLWTDLGGNTFLSKQSPWMGLGDTPSWYIGRVSVKLTINGAGELQFLLTDGTAGVVQPTATPLRLQTTLVDFIIIANPYQFVIFPKTGSALGTFKKTIAVSVLHVPSFAANSVRIAGTLFGSEARFLFGEWTATVLHNSFTAVRTETQTNQWFGEVGSGNIRIYPIGTTDVFRINKITDHIIAPVMPAWGTTSINDAVRIKGFMWDLIFISEELALGSKHVVNDRTYYVMANHFGNSILHELE